MNSTFLLREIWNLLLTIQESKEFLIAPFAREYGLTPLQLRTLIEVGRLENLSLSHLSRSLDMNNGNTSTLCKRLEGQGWLIRQRRSDDERYIALTLTAKGKAMLQHLEQHLQEQYDPALEQVDEAAVQRIQAGLVELHRLTQLLTTQQTNRKDDENVQQ